MAIIDAQVHAYERNHPGRPWAGFLEGPAEVTGADMVAAMDAVGVDGALLVSPFSMYRYDASYALGVYAAYPQRFRLIKPVDPKHHMTAGQLSKAEERPAAAPTIVSGNTQAPWPIPIAWLLVLIPLSWGIGVTLQKAVLLFK